MSNDTGWGYDTGRGLTQNSRVPELLRTRP